ncbi:hypothetical protein MAR_019210 [Mya arenaria]|uniref:Uncharacterized protein n=1 Tax=Mya arenaria TaxID=6604 RepID=A0ABY7EJX9_MYAAR|nr:hypothetical protein MAR_019210 [Mya arenaria]
MKVFTCIVILVTLAPKVVQLTQNFVLHIRLRPIMMIQKYRSRSPPLLPLLPPRRPIVTTPDLVPPTFPDDYGDIYEVKIFHKKPIPTPKKRTSLANEDGGYMQTPKPDKQAPPSDQSHQNDTGKKSDRDLLIDLLEANKNIMESQKEIKSSIAEHQKILNVVFETPIYQDYYNSKLTGPVVPPRDDNGEESDHHTEADEVPAPYRHTTVVLAPYRHTTVLLATYRHTTVLLATYRLTIVMLAPYRHTTECLRRTAIPLSAGYVPPYH